MDILNKVESKYKLLARITRSIETKSLSKNFELAQSSQLEERQLADRYPGEDTYPIPPYDDPLY